MSKGKVSSLAERRVTDEHQATDEDVVPEQVRPANVRVTPIVGFTVAALAKARSKNPSEVVKAALADYFVYRLAAVDLSARIEEKKIEMAKRAAETFSVLAQERLDGENPVAPPPVRNKESGTTQSLWVRLEPSHINRLNALALLDDDTTLAQQIRRALKFYLPAQYDEKVPELDAYREHLGLLNKHAEDDGHDQRHAI